MEIALSKAKARLSELGARADRGEEVVITRRGNSPLRLVSDQRQPTKAERWATLEQLFGAAKDAPGMKDVSAADADKFLYGDDGLPA